MTIDTEVKGEPGDVLEVADWLATTRADAMLRGHQEVSMGWAQSSSGWHGASGEAYRSASAALGEASDVYRRVLVATAGAVRDYAEALGDHQREMAAFCEEARGAGLTVDVDRIQDPRLSDVTYDAAPGRDDPGYAEFEAEQAAHAERVRVYDSIKGRVETARTTFTAWIECNLRSKVEFVGGEDLLSFPGNLPTVPRVGVGVAANTVKGAIKSVADLPEDAKKVSEAVSTVTLGAYQSAAERDAEPLVKYVLDAASGPVADVATSGVKKGPWSWLAGGVVATGVDEATSGAAGALVADDVKDPDDYLGPPDHAPYEDPPFLPGEHTNPRGVRRG